MRIEFASACAGGLHDGSFRTAPPRNKAAPVRLAFGGDVAGQNVCDASRSEGVSCR